MDDTAANASAHAAHFDAVLDFWFDVDASDAEALKRQNRGWFMSSREHDLELAQRFGDLARAAADGKLDSWAASARGRLALIILLDQLPRNLHRGTPEAFAQDARALELCREGLESGLVQALPPLQRVFFCMPLQHAESREIQRLSVDTFAAIARAPAPPALSAALAGFANYAVMHREIVDRFGRFPHRNAILGRQSTDAEQEFLASGGPSFGQ
jgi:uncharacterized protein (DUF924 family)